MLDPRNPRNAVVLIASLLAVCLLGCERIGGFPGKGDPALDESIEEFVQSEPLGDPQEPELLLTVAEGDVQMFGVAFGQPRDCPAGCFFSRGYGLKFRGRIGWMGLDAYGGDDSVRTEVTYFDVQPEDSQLFKDTTRAQLEAALTDDGRTLADPAYDQFLEMLAEDEDTPSDTLLDLAELLHDQYRPATGLALLENSVVRSNETILEVLAGLSASGYKQVRSQAQDLLDQL